MPLLTIRGLNKYYGNFKALDDFELTLNANEIYGFIGKNGAGKTTTLNVLMQLSFYETGTITFDGKKLNKDDYTFRKMVAYMPDVPSFPRYLKGREILELTAEFCGYDSKKTQEKINELKDSVGLLRLNQKVGTYSRGMVQRLALANALMQEPKLLIMDEPTSALDPIGRRAFLTIIKSVAKETSVLYSTHILSEAEAICDRVGLIDKGKMLKEGSVTEVIAPAIDATYIIDTLHPKRIIDILTNQTWIKAIEPKEKHIEVTLTDATPAKLFRALASVDEKITAVYEKVPSLEEAFVEVLNENAI